MDLEDAIADPGVLETLEMLRSRTGPETPTATLEDVSAFLAILADRTSGIEAHLENISNSLSVIATNIT